MHERTQFADFVVSQALQLNAQCLQTLTLVSSSDVPLEADFNAMRGDVERLGSLWQILGRCVDKSTFRQGRKRIKRALALIPEGSGWVQSAAKQIAGKTDDERKQRSLALIGEKVCARAYERAYEKVGKPVTKAAAVTANARCAELGQIFQAESCCWRDDASLRDVPDAELIEQGIVRVYEKSRGVCQAYVRHPGSAKRLARTRRWLRHNVNHLELLQPALSERSSAHVWYLQRLQTNIHKQFLVNRFMEIALGDPKVARIKAKTRARVQLMAQERIERLQSRTVKLMHGAFAPDLEDFSRVVADAVSKLALQEIVLMPLPEPGAGGGRSA